MSGKSFLEDMRIKISNIMTVNEEQYDQKLSFPILTVINGRSSADDDIHIMISSTGANENWNVAYHHRNLPCRKCQQKIVILGDSHTHSCEGWINWKFWGYGFR